MTSEIKKGKENMQPATSHYNIMLACYQVSCSLLVTKCLSTSCDLL